MRRTGSSARRADLHFGVETIEVSACCPAPSWETQTHLVRDISKFQIGRKLGRILWLGGLRNDSRECVDFGAQRSQRNDLDPPLFRFRHLGRVRIAQSSLRVVARLIEGGKDEVRRLARQLAVVRRSDRGHKTSDVVERRARIGIAGKVNVERLRSGDGAGIGEGSFEEAIGRLEQLAVVDAQLEPANADDPRVLTLKERSMRSATEARINAAL